MTTSESLRCVLIGSDSLLVECGERLLREGHTLTHVVTDQERLADWARSHSIDVLDAEHNFALALRGASFDCLFSITWLSILPEEVLALPKRWAINFHDGPLPNYAGLYTPAWAIKNGESRYGVTWHSMVADVDRGDILEQELFDLADGETSLTLNTRCFEAGLASFERLIAALASNSVQPRPQSSGQRSYFGKFDRPSGACSLDWGSSATELEALVRALDFGRYPNPLGTAKIHSDGETLSVTSAEARTTAGAPGRILALTADEIVVGTGDGALALTGFAHACGAPLSAADLATRWSLVLGGQLGQLNPEQRDRLTQFSKQLARHEGFWVRRLAALEPLELPWSLPQGPSPQRMRESVEVTLPATFLDGRGASDFQTGCVAAIGSYLARISGKGKFHVGYRQSDDMGAWQEFAGWFAPVVPFEFTYDCTATFADASQATAREIEQVTRRGTWFRDVLGRTPALRERAELARAALLPVEIASVAGTDSFDERVAPGLSFLIVVEKRELVLSFDPGVVTRESVEAMRRQLETWFASVAEGAEPLSTLELMPADEKQRVLADWNATDTVFDRGVTVQALFAEQALATPDQIALVFGADELSYRHLNERANQLAQHLVQLGVQPGQLVGVNLERSIDLMVAVLGVLKAGGAYLPLDPEFPSDRIAFMISDAEATVILTQDSLAALLPKTSARIVCIDGEQSALASNDCSAPSTTATSSDLAYAIYTSGSTGLPKGVLVEHRNVINFFAGMDERVGAVEGGVWLAVTSLSFDISVLELLWTACRGFKTVLYAGLRAKSAANRNALDFGLSFFASNRNEDPATQYDFLLDSARFADQNGFASIWTPERHFHAFGGLYPNPSVTSAAIAAITENIHIRSGSVVVALHHPIRIAEEWSLVDNLSKGRVGISIASGWHPNDFVLAPDCYADRKNLMVHNTQIVRKLWRGEAVAFPGPNGEDVETRIMPRPLQPELPIWITAAGNPETFRQAGELGANVLTHLLGQSTEELASKLAVYQQAWKDAGHAGKGKVSLMLHTFIGENIDEIREIVREPMREYLRSAVDLIKNHVSSWSAVKKSVDGGKAPEIGSLEDLPAEDIEALLDYSFERYFETSALFGTPESAFAMLEKLHHLGIDEITCLVDFGVPCETVLNSYPKLDELRRLANERLCRPEAPRESIDELLRKHAVTHMQCTPSMANMLVEDETIAAALEQLDVLMVGGEPFPPELAQRLNEHLQGRLLNMYGPTETTIWSSTLEVARGRERMTIGTPIANTQLYVLDAQLQPLPVGVTGELYIGGAGVTRGYHNRPELTAERFVPNPFISGESMYRTGDVARWLPSGEVEFQGRIDHQVKVRGYRIELGEIESVLDKHDHVSRAVVVTRGESGAARLVAFVIASDSAEPTPRALAAHLSESLPDYMVPEEFQFVDSFPLTPNKKIDRNALAKFTPPKPKQVQAVASTSVPVARPPQELDDFDLEATIETLLSIWRDVLGTDSCGPDENFFDLGGHSLLTIRVQKAIREELSISIPLVDMFRFTTVRTLAERLAPQPESSVASESEGPSRAAQRAAKRRRRAS